MEKVADLGRREECEESNSEAPKTGDPIETESSDASDDASSEEIVENGLRNNEDEEAFEELQQDHRNSGPEETEQDQDEGVLAIDDSDGDNEEFDDDDDSSSSDGEEDETPLESPSENIRNDFEAALDDKFEFQGTFAWGQSFKQAPNPCLDVTGLGPIGLPLSVREAMHLIRVCTQAAFGKNEKTIIDKKVRDTWELSPEKFQFLNPEWTQWVQSTIVPAATQALGVSPSGAKPQAELYKLLLYEPGSHFLPHQDTEKSPGMFATIVIVLPSKYDGAAVQLSHGGQAKVLDFAKSSAITTSALAWYSDVFHSVEPVQSGYRLALSYNLIHPPSSTAPRPVLPSSNSAIEKLRHVLLSWKQNRDKKAPHKLAYRLEHQYSLVGLQAGSLKGSDAYLVSHLAQVAEPLHFRIRLANVELHQVGTSGDTGYPRHARGWGYYDEEYSSDMGDDATMEDVSEETMTIEDMVDLEGEDVEIPADFKIDEDEEMIPGPMGEGEPDEKEAEGYQGNEGGEVQYWYRHTYLLIWPKSEDLYVTKRDILDHICEKLEDRLEIASQSSPREKDLNCMNRLLKICATRDPALEKSNLERAFAILEEGAYRWKDGELWVRSVRGCGGMVDISIVGPQGFVTAWNTFGFGPIKSLLKEVLTTAKSNAQRFELVDVLSDLAEAQHNDDAISWCKNQRQAVLRSLRLLAARDIPHLISIMKTKGVGVLRDVIMPQMEANPPSLAVKISFVQDLHNHRPVIPPNVAAVSDIETRLLSVFLSQVRLYPTKEVTEGSSWAPKKKIIGLPENTYSIIDLCIKTDNVGALKSVFTKMRDAFESGPDAQKLFRTIQHLLPLTEKLEETFAKRPKLRPREEPWSILYGMAGDILRCILSSENAVVYIPKLLGIIRRAGNIPVLKDVLLPRVPDLAKKNVETIRTIAKTLYGGRQSILEGASPTDMAAFDEIVQILVTTTINHTDIQVKGTASQPSHYPTYGYSSYNEYTQKSGVALDLIKFCFTFTSSRDASCQRVLRRLYPTSGTKKVEHYTGYLQPIITNLRTYLASQNLGLASPLFREFVTTCVQSYVRDILGPKPSEKISQTELSSVGCGCVECGAVKTFLLGPQKQVILARVQGVRTHLERNLAATRKWGITWETRRSGSPHQLVVTKPDHMVAPGRWRQNRLTGLTFLSALGNESDQKNILQSNYAAIASALELRPSVGSSSATIAGSGAIGSVSPHQTAALTSLQKIAKAVYSAKPVARRLPTTKSIPATNVPPVANTQSTSSARQHPPPKVSSSKSMLVRAAPSAALPDQLVASSATPSSSQPSHPRLVTELQTPRRVVSGSKSASALPSSSRPSLPKTVAGMQTPVASSSASVVSGSKRPPSGGGSVSYPKAKKPKTTLKADVEIIDISSD